MIEPTESESKAELDKFISAMKSIREEINAIASGKSDDKDNVLKNAPHTIDLVTNDVWEKPYSRQQAAFPLEYVNDNKFWPSVSRVDDAFGDRNLVCSCESIESYN
jgi:glycine dehydrogenase